MPRGDQTGPMGQGSGTGRKAGYCSGADAPGFGSAPGRGGRPGRMGRGGMAIRGGRGGTWCRGQGGAGFMPGSVPEDAAIERQALLEQARIMQAGLDALTERLARLEKSAGQE